MANRNPELCRVLSLLTHLKVRPQFAPGRRIFFGPQKQRRLSGVCSLGGAVIPMVGR
jgi:hypothetical protein